MNHPVLSVLDNTNPNAIVLWHLQTDPAAPAGIATGAWILGVDEAQGPERLPDLLHGTVVVPTSGSNAPEGETITSVERVRAGVEKRLVEYSGHGATLPKLSAPGVAPTYRGEAAAERAWRTAMELVELVAAWHEIESARRSRKILAEAFGSDVSPLPLD